MTGCAVPSSWRQGIDALAADKRGDASLDLAPSRRFNISTPIAQIGALNLVEGHRRKLAVNAQLNQFVRMPGHIGLGADPFRFRPVTRPDDEHGPGCIEPLEDHVMIRAVRRQILVPPDAIAVVAQNLADRLCVGFGRARVRNENLRAFHHWRSLSVARMEKHARFAAANPAFEDERSGRARRARPPRRGAFVSR